MGVQTQRRSLRGLLYGKKGMQDARDHFQKTKEMAVGKKKGKLGQARLSAKRGGND